MSLSMEDSLRAMFGKPLANLPTFIDIGRLSRRIDVLITEEDEICYKNTANSYRQSTDLSQSHAECLAKVVKKVLLQLEPEEDHEKLLKAVDEFEEKAGESLDLQNFVRDMFKSFDENGRTVKIFKMINQAALSIAVTVLKVNVATQKSSLPPEVRMTKDVRTSEGWRIVIKITDNAITVSHIRKEQTLGQPMSPDYWDVKWRLDMHFSGSMSELTSADIEILDMTFGPSIPQEMKEELERLYKSFDVHKPPENIIPTPNYPTSKEKKNFFSFCSIM